MQKKRWRSLTLLFGVVLGMTGGLAWMLTSAHAATTPEPISPYIWGTNLSLYDKRDGFLTNKAIQQVTQQAHVQMIRFPDREDLAVTTAAAKKIKALKMVPLLILHYGEEDLERNKQLIQMMNSVFGSETVYYEFGNEMDLARNGAIQKEEYTRSWNTVIPQLKPLARKGKFLGPSTYKWNPIYVGYFVQQASPRPDAVSWHEYTCGTKDSDQRCLASIENWTKHIKDTREAMQVDLPIMITEYNWNANPDPDPQKGTPADARATNSAFLTQWTKRAIEVLVENGIFAAHHYVLTNNERLAMIADASSTLTAAGKAFQETYLRSQGQITLGKASPTMTSSPVPGQQTLCFPDRSQATSPPGSPARMFCVPVMSQDGEEVSEQPLGTICFPLYPLPPQGTAGTAPSLTPSSRRTMCVPVYEGKATTKTSSPSPPAATTRSILFFLH